VQTYLDLSTSGARGSKSGINSLTTVGE